MDSCVEACDSLDCSPDPNGNEECIEYYNHGVCGCRRIVVSEGQCVMVS